MKKIISIILAAAMMLSLIPSVFAAGETDEPIKIVYNFAGGITNRTTFGTAKGENWTVAGFKDSTTDTTMTTAVGSGKKISRNSTYNAIRVSATEEGKYSVAFELTLDKTARYSLTVKAVAASGLSESGPYVDAYLFEKSTVSSIEEGITDQNKFSSSKFTQVGEEEELSFDKEKYLTAGDYYFVYSPMITSGSGGWVTLLSLTLSEEDAILTGEFIQEDDEQTLATYAKPTAIGVIKDGTLVDVTPVGANAYTLTAPETNETGNEFLYWALGLTGNKRILSFERTLGNYVPAGEGRNYLIAVYEGDIEDITTPEYYNINGQLIAKADNEPAELPSIPGLGTAEGWKHCGGNIFVAKYEDLDRDNVIVTADNCTVNGKTETEVDYGDLVTCTANGEGKFKCWKKNGEIVSVDEAYSFNAWEDCTVEAVYEEHTYNGSHMNILIDSFDIETGVTGIMAEFIGFGSDVVEKGIMFTATGATEAIKIPMTTTANQLTVVADAGTYEGYAILEKGEDFTLVTDGSYTK